MIQVTRDSAGNIRGRTYTATLVDYKNRVYNVISASTLNGGPWGAKGIEPQTVMHLRRKPGVVWACYQVAGWSRPRRA